MGKIENFSINDLHCECTIFVTNDTSALITLYSYIVTKQWSSAVGFVFRQDCVLVDNAGHYPAFFKELIELLEIEHSFIEVN